MSVQYFYVNQPFTLESGSELSELTIAYHTFGRNRGQPVVWVCHAFSGNSNPLEWWSGLFGEGKIFDPQRHFIVCANFLGSCYGTTNALSLNPHTKKPYGLDFPIFSVRDMVKAHILLRKHLKIQEIAVLIGPSLGGFQALEWAVMEPHLIHQLVLVATNAQQSPWGVALNETQRMALEADSTWGELNESAAAKGLETARAIAMISYRSYQGYCMTQRDEEEKLDGFRASSYQRYQGQKFRKRFHAYAYWFITKAMDTHNLGRGRGGVEAALRMIRSKTYILAISSDGLYPPQESQFMASHIPDAHFEIFDSEFGHDGFLVATDKIAAYLEKSINLYF